MENIKFLASDFCFGIRASTKFLIFQKLKDLELLYRADTGTISYFEIQRTKLQYNVLKSCIHTIDTQ